jgi:hypothetical protein
VLDTFSLPLSFFPSLLLPAAVHVAGMALWGCTFDIVLVCMQVLMRPSTWLT